MKTSIGKIRTFDRSGGEDHSKDWWCPRRQKGIDQLQIVVDQLKSNPTSRRILWEGWFTSIVNRFGRFDPALTV